MIRTFHDVAALARGASELFARTAQSAVKQRGRFTVALSGGNSPRPLYELLAGPENIPRTPWEKVFVFWGDERYVPPEDNRSNSGQAWPLLLDHVPVSTDQVFPMYRSELSPDEAATAYEERIRRHFDQEPPRFDLILLGCGENGHTASLFPGTPVLEETERLVAPVQVQGQDIARLTFTTSLINQARMIVFIAYGQKKASIIQAVLAGPHRPKVLPAQLIKPSNGVMYWFLDSEAAAKLVSPPSPEN